MRRLLPLLILLSLMAVAAVTLANPSQLGGTWRAMVLKQGDQKTKLKDYELLLTFDTNQGSWSAQTTKDGEQQTVEGTYLVDDVYVILETQGRSYPMRVTVTDNQLVLSPKDDPALRLIALRVR